MQDRNVSFETKPFPGLGEFVTHVQGVPVHVFTVKGYSPVLGAGSYELPPGEEILWQNLATGQHVAV